MMTSITSLGPIFLLIRLSCLANPLQENGTRARVALKPGSLQSTLVLDATYPTAFSVVFPMLLVLLPLGRKIALHSLDR